MTFSPKDFVPGMSQGNAFEMLKTGSSVLKSSFDIALATTRSNWVKIFQEIDLQDKEVLIARSHNHAIAIHRKNNAYVVYDPNYCEGVRTFKTEQELVDELHFEVFQYSYLSNTGLSLNLLRHPDADNSRTFPDLATLYKTYFTDSYRQYGGKASTGFFSGKEFDTLTRVLLTISNETFLSDFLKEMKPNLDETRVLFRKVLVGHNLSALKCLLDYEESYAQIWCMTN